MGKRRVHHRWPLFVLIVESSLKSAVKDQGLFANQATQPPPPPPPPSPSPPPPSPQASAARPPPPGFQLEATALLSVSQPFCNWCPLWTRGSEASGSCQKDFNPCSTQKPPASGWWTIRASVLIRVKRKLLISTVPRTVPRLSRSKIERKIKHAVTRPVRGSPLERRKREPPSDTGL